MVQHTHTHTITHSIVAHGMRPHLIKAALCAQIPVVAGFSPTYATTKYISDWLKAQRGRWRDTEREWVWQKRARHRTFSPSVIHTRLDRQYAGVSRDGYTLLANNKSPLTLFPIQVRKHSWSSSSTSVWIFVDLKKKKVFCCCWVGCHHNTDLRQGALFQSTRTKRGPLRAEICLSSQNAAALGLTHTHRCIITDNIRLHTLTQA